jgi:hypothetical protein
MLKQNIRENEEPDKDSEDVKISKILLQQTA